MRRPRGPGGRFLTADEVAAMDRQAGGDPAAEGGADDGADKENIDAKSLTPTHKSNKLVSQHQYLSQVQHPQPQSHPQLQPQAQQTGSAQKRKASEINQKVGPNAKRTRSLGGNVPIGDAGAMPQINGDITAEDNGDGFG